jgi:hypothetical protein
MLVTHSEASDIQSQPDSSEQKEEAPRRLKRTKKGIPAEKLSYKVKTDDIHEPASLEDMMSLPSRERVKWIAAAREEITQMQQRKVWTLTELLPGRKAITSKWVFKMKCDSRGQTSTCKARLVARGFSQLHGSRHHDQTSSKGSAKASCKCHANAI